MFTNFLSTCMEGAILAGKLAADRVSSDAAGVDYFTSQEKPIQQHIVDQAATASPKKPVGVKGEGAIAFGGGYSLTDRAWQEVSEQDPDQLIPMDERAATKQTTMAMTKENEGN